jgi:hypothetical protein
MNRNEGQTAVSRTARIGAMKNLGSTWAVTLALCTSLATTCAHANDLVDCRQLDAAAGGPDDNFRPPVSATVTGQTRANFYSAPAAQCKMKRTFLVPGDVVTVYKPYKSWYQVMYVNKRTGDDFEGWIEQGRLRLGDTRHDDQ